MIYNCPGVKAGWYLSYPQQTIYEEVKCENWMGWWRKTFIGQCNACIKIQQRRGTLQE